MARRIGAISCVIVRRTSRWRPRTTMRSASCRTFCRSIRNGARTAGPVVVIGAGGGARAVVYSLGDRGAREIRVVNRTLHAPRPGPGIWATRVARSMGRAASGAGRRGDAGQHDEPGDGRSAAARSRARQAPHTALVCDIVYVPVEHATARRRRADAETRPWTGSACCCTRDVRREGVVRP